MLECELAIYSLLLLNRVYWVSHESLGLLRLAKLLMSKCGE